MKIATLSPLIPLLLAPLMSTPSPSEELPLASLYDVPGVEYSADIPKPEDVIGHRVGTRHTRPHQLVEYFQAVAAASDRVVLREHGRTYENRPLIHAIVTSPQNHNRLERIRQANLSLSDNPSSVSNGALESMPAVVYLGYSVHGNEASGSEAALVTLYHLAAGQGDSVRQSLDNLVVIIDPSLNPDGRDRFVDWVNANRAASATIDSQDREHREPWPGGRTNHYWFDLNRDWIPAQLPESQARLRLFHHWRPQLHTDHHEMGANNTFFFMPGIPSRNNPNTPQRTTDLTAEIASFHARFFDRLGVLYYSQESFDDFYYGKGSTYPDVNGAIGILYEQASSRGLQRETDSGRLDYAFTIRNHVSVSLSSLQAAVEMRVKLLKHQRDFYREARQAAADNSVKAYLIDFSGPRRTQAQELARTLLRHRIRIQALARDIESGGRTYRAGQTYLIPMNQPQTRLIKAMMEKVTTFQDVLFYDVSAWTLPLAFGLRYAELNALPSAAAGDRIESVELDGGQLTGPHSDYAYLMEWGRYYAPRALYRLLEAGVRPRLATLPFEAATAQGRRRFEAGTIVIPVRQRDGDSRLAPSEVRALIDAIVSEDQVVVHPVSTGLTPDGPDLGGASLRSLKKPRVALLSGEGTSAYQVGAIWHLLGERMKVPVSLLDLRDIGRADLSGYDVLLLPSGRLSGLDPERVKQWVAGGKTLIALGQGARWVVEKEILSEKLRKIKRDTGSIPYAEVSRTRGAQVIGGSIFEVTLDRTHPVAFGQPEKLAVFRNHVNFFEASKTPGANVALYTDSPLLSGYISQENLKELPGTASVLARRVGGGRVILFADAPAFRAFWFGSSGLLLNAVFFGGAF